MNIHVNQKIYITTKRERNIIIQVKFEKPINRTRKRKKKKKLIMRETGVQRDKEIN